ncbi:MFS transporter [Laceyella putida]|uniref:MFS transporter n=1 Tax=Laceyella putida TaxID=110101 RepID=A0ABW2RMT3_9BACL
MTRFKRFTLETFVVAMMLIIIDMIILAPVLPFVMGEYHLPTHWAVWIISLHLAVFSFALPVMENWAVSMGRMKILYVSLGFILLGTWVAFVAKPWIWLMWGRVVQSVGMSGVVPYIAVQIRRLMSKQNRRKQMGTLLLWGSTVAFTPWVAAWLTLLLGWRFAFLLHGLLIIVLFIASRKWVCSDRPKRVRIAGDASIFFFGLILLFIMAGLTNTNLLGGWRALVQPEVLPLWIVGIGMVVPLLMMERQKSHPFFEPHLFANWRFWLLYGQVGLSGFIWMALLLIPGWAAHVYRLDYITSGALFTYLLLCSLFALLFVRLAARVWGFRPTAVMGYGLSALAFVVLAADREFVWSFMALSLLSFSLCFVFAAPVHQPLLAWMPNRRMRSGMMTLGMFRAAGGAIGLLTIARVFTSADPHLLTWTAEAPIPPQVIAEAQSSVFWFLAIVSLVGVVLSLLVRFQRPVS